MRDEIEFQGGFLGGDPEYGNKQDLNKKHKEGLSFLDVDCPLIICSPSMRTWSGSYFL